jgi:hypothetical protein
MPVFELEKDKKKIIRGETEPVVAGAGGPKNSNWDQIQAWQQEIDAYYTVLTTLDEQGAENVMMFLSSLGARAAEIRSQVNRNDSRRAQAFRIKEVDPFISALEFQFKVWSRFVSIKEFDMRLSRGQL